MATTKKSAFNWRWLDQRPIVPTGEGRRIARGYDAAARCRKETTTVFHRPRDLGLITRARKPIRTRDGTDDSVTCSAGYRVNLSAVASRGLTQHPGHFLDGPDETVFVEGLGEMRSEAPGE